MSTATKASLKSRLDAAKNEDKPKAKAAASTEPKAKAPPAEPKAKKTTASEPKAKKAASSESKETKAKESKPKNTEPSVLDQNLAILSRIATMSVQQKKKLKSRVSDDIQVHQALDVLSSAIVDITSTRSGKTAIRKLDSKVVDLLSSLDFGTAFSVTKDGRRSVYSSTGEALQDSLVALHDGYTTEEHIAALVRLLPRVGLATLKVDKERPMNSLIALGDEWSFLSDTIDEINKNRTNKIENASELTARDLGHALKQFTSDVSDEEIEQVTQDYNESLNSELEALDLACKHYKSDGDAAASD